MNIKQFQDNSPVRSTYLSLNEFVDLTGACPTRIDELIELGWLEVRETSSQGRLFRSRDAYRLRKLERLCRDFELSIIGGVIIVDLLARIEELEQKLRELSGLAG